MVRHQAAGEIYPKTAIVGDSPILMPVWAAGSSFSRGHRVARVPYDLYRLIFDGEEFMMAVRLWTAGYDFYTFHSVLIFHPYARKTRPNTFWENRQDMTVKSRAVRRTKVVLGMKGTDVEQGDTKDLMPGGKYGLGTRRPISTYLRLWGFDLEKKTARDNCQWVYSQEMHRQLVAYLRTDRRGIDYSRVPVDAILKQTQFG